MAITLKQVETITTYADAPTGLSTEAAALDPVFIWHRIENYISHRFTARAVVWTVEGLGDWEAPLSPATVTAVEVWAGDAWNEALPSPSPYGGYVLASDGPYRITATVGAGPVPAAVDEAFRRLAEYISDGITPGAQDGRSGASSNNVEIGDIKYGFQRNPAWMARAMINSGAGDLLRPYRRAA